MPLPPPGQPSRNAAILDDLDNGLEPGQVRSKWGVNGHDMRTFLAFHQYNLPAPRRGRRGRRGNRRASAPPPSGAPERAQAA